MFKRSKKLNFNLKKKLKKFIFLIYLFFNYFKYYHNKINFNYQINKLRTNLIIKFIFKQVIFF